jgi:hypothetical protein
MSRTNAIAQAPFSLAKAIFSIGHAADADTIRCRFASKQYSNERKTQRAVFLVLLDDCSNGGALVTVPAGV